MWIVYFAIDQESYPLEITRGWSKRSSFQGVYNSIISNKWHKERHVYPIQCQCCRQIETSQLICCANQLTGFYMRAPLALNGLTLFQPVFMTCMNKGPWPATLLKMSLFPRCFPHFASKNHPPGFSMIWSLAWNRLKAVIKIPDSEIIMLIAQIVLMPDFEFAFAG